MPSTADRLVECRLCPRRCKLAENERGDCRVRVNLNGELITLVYGKPCAVHVDPVEKKPLFHFLPGSSIFSIATAGCNLHCRHCQNWTISQADPETTRNIDLPPAAVVAATQRHGCRAIAYTYSDPVIYFEYAADTSRLAMDAGLKNVLVTAGYIEPEPLAELCAVTQAANVDLKAFSDRFYREVCDARLAPVLDTLETMKRLGVWLEVTNLVIPTLNDDPGMLREMCAWMVEKLGPDTPLHISRFHPQYRLDRLPPTPPATLIMAAEIAEQAGLHYVYVGNLRDAAHQTTHCPRCRKPVIARAGYRITELNLNDGRCGFCGEAIPGVWT